MSMLRLVGQSLVHRRRLHLPVALAVAVATAVLTGALLVGDCMRGSLRRVALDRLGCIDSILAPGITFRESLADELAEDEGFDDDFSAVVPVFLLGVSIENPSPDEGGINRRANQINLIGCDERFWQLDSRGDLLPPEDFHGRRVVLNRTLAGQLGVTEGDAVIVRLPRRSAIPAETPLGRRTDRVFGSRLTVAAIVEDAGLGRFDLRASQHHVRNAFVPLSWLQDRLEEPERVNTLLVAGRKVDHPAEVDAQQRLQAILRPRHEDLGLQVERSDHGYWNLTTPRMVFSNEMETQLLDSVRAFQVQPVLIHLANTIELDEHGKREIPYSTVAAVDLSMQSPLGPLLDVAGDPIDPIQDDQIVLNAWAADQLGASKDDTVRLRYFEPETVDGLARETKHEFRVAAITAMSGLAVDPGWTPRVEGITDQPNMDDWKPPFPFDDKRIGDDDETYWKTYRAAPKAFITLAAGRQLWESRFGRTTSLRVAVDASSGGTSPRNEGRDGGSSSSSSPPRPSPEALGRATDLDEVMTLQPDRLGFVFDPVKRRSLDAALGTTPFSVLFLGFSGFLIIAAVLLVALLFRLNIHGRAKQIGVLLALGWTRRRVVRLLCLEGLVVAGIGAAVGTVAGIGYAALMVLGLTTLWLDAVVTPFLSLHITATSLAAGFSGGVVTAGLTMVLSVRRVMRTQATRLLEGDSGLEPSWIRRPGRWGFWLAAGLMLLAVAASLIAMQVDRTLQAGLFFAAGFLVLASMMTAIGRQLRGGAIRSAVTSGRGNLFRLAFRNTTSNPTRATLTIGLVAAASFLIVALDAFRLDPRSGEFDRDGGSGGFALLAESAQPIHHDPNDPDGRAVIGFTEADETLLGETHAHAFRLRQGDDASCRNLYRPTEPTILGAPRSFVARGGFRFSTHADGDEHERSNPWLLLNRRLGPSDDGTPRVPVILDMATAQYSLHLGSRPGSILSIPNGTGGRLDLEVVGLLATSIFQGKLIVSDNAFDEHFPQVVGRRLFLIESSEERLDGVTQAWERVLADDGISIETTTDRLAGLMAVQNTYLSTFQTLGGLGLLLGTFALAAVQLRAVEERRGELAVLRAVGLRRGWIGRMVLVEHAMLLLAGLGSGVTAAVIAVLPHWAEGTARPPWIHVGGLLGLVLVVGLAVGLAAVRRAMGGRLVGALRAE